MTNPRIGDLVVATNGRTYRIVTLDFAWLEAEDCDGTRRRRNGTRYRRKFGVDRLECIDHDDGIWQETER